jgi:predicted membrane protein
MTISTIVAEAPTLGQAIRNIVNPLMLLAVVLCFGVAIFSHWKEDFAQRNRAIFILIVLILFWIIAGTMIFPAGPAQNPHSLN